MPSPDSPFLTADDLIEFFAERPQLRRLALACVLPAERVEGAWRYRRADLEEWLSRQDPQLVASSEGDPA